MPLASPMRDQTAGHSNTVTTEEHTSSVYCTFRATFYFHQLEPLVLSCGIVGRFQNQLPHKECQNQITSKVEDQWFPASHACPARYQILLPQARGGMLLFHGYLHSLGFRDHREILPSTRIALERARARRSLASKASAVWIDLVIRPSNAACSRQGARVHNQGLLGSTASHRAVFGLRSRQL
jgi:hypothetical protein